MTAPSRSSQEGSANPAPRSRGSLHLIISRLPERQFFLYALIGSSGVLLDLAAFVGLHDGLGVDKFIATATSTTVGITNNFGWNARYNFRVTDRLPMRFARFYATGLVGVGITSLLFLLFVDVAGWDTNVVKVLSLGPVLLVQYVVNKRWSFG